MVRIIPIKRRSKRHRAASAWNFTPKGPKGPTKLVLVVTGLSVGIALGCAIIFGPRLIEKARVQEPTYQAAFGFCHEGGGQNCVVDGDTFWINGEKVRVMDIDAPETHPPRCAFEAELGNRATRRLQELLNAGPFQMESGGDDTDQYGRKLRVITRDGDSIGSILVDEGLARRWSGSRQPWC